MAWHGVAWRGMAWRGMAWRGVAWHGMYAFPNFCNKWNACTLTFVEGADGSLELQPVELRTKLLAERRQLLNGEASSLRLWFGCEVRVVRDRVRDEGGSGDGLFRVRLQWQRRLRYHNNLNVDSDLN